MPQQPEHIFVYGTLRRGRHEMARLLAEEAVEAGQGTIQARLFLVDDYPGVELSGDSRTVACGEVYRLVDEETILAALDDYEGFDPGDPVGSLFVRRVVPVRLSDGTVLPAWVYVYNRPTEGLPEIASGDFHGVRPRRRALAPA